MTDELNRICDGPGCDHPEHMTEEQRSVETLALTREIVGHLRELRAALEPLLADPSQLFAGMGPLGAVFGGLLGGVNGRRG
ncbi:MAG TPA: hypothetical protein VFI97_03610 [Arthrobacter sp.]|nr:hypothetical protein [Arthrobacter sp.]